MMAKIIDLLEYKFGGRDNTRAAFSSLDRSLARTETRAERLRRKFSGLGAGIGKLGRAFGGAGAIAGGLSLTFGLASVRKEMGELDALSKQISTSGLSSDLFQTLQFATNEASVSQERLNAATLKFSAGIGELRGGFGTLSTSLKALNPELATQLKLAGSTDEAFLTFADAVKNAKDQEQALALVSAVTGKRASELFRVFALGREGLSATGDKARELGVILEDDLLQRAEKLENAFGNAAFAIDRKFKSTLIDLAPVLVGTADLISGTTSTIGKMVDGIAGFFELASQKKSILFGDKTTFKNGIIPDFDITGFQVAEKKINKVFSGVEKTKTKAEQTQKSIVKLTGSANVFGSTLGGAFESLIFDGVKFSDVLKGIGRQFASSAIQSAFSNLGGGLFGNAGGSGGGGFLSAIFGGARAGGGPVSAGKSFLVGESGPELFMPKSAGTIVPNSGGMRGGTTVNMSVNLDARGAAPEAVAAINAKLENLKKTIPELAVAAVSSARVLRPGRV